MISDALIAVEFETHIMYRDLIASKLGYVVDRNWTNSSSDETVERWRFLNKIISPELMSQCQRPEAASSCYHAICLYHNVDVGGPNRYNNDSYCAGLGHRGDDL